HRAAQSAGVILGWKTHVLLSTSQLREMSELPNGGVGSRACPAHRWTCLGHVHWTCLGHVHWTYPLHGTRAGMVAPSSSAHVSAACPTTHARAWRDGGRRGQSSGTPAKREQVVTALDERALAQRRQRLGDLHRQPRAVQRGERLVGWERRVLEVAR